MLFFAILLRAAGSTRWWFHQAAGGPAGIPTGFYHVWVKDWLAYNRYRISTVITLSATTIWRWPPCSIPSTSIRSRGHNLGTIRKFPKKGVNPMKVDSLISFWCRRPDLNRHEVAPGGFWEQDFNWEKIFIISIRWFNWQLSWHLWFRLDLLWKNCPWRAHSGHNF